MFGWCGKTAVINLSEGEFKTFSPDPEILLKFIGGKGLAGPHHESALQRRRKRTLDDLPEGKAVSDGKSLPGL